MAAAAVRASTTTGTGGAQSADRAEMQARRHGQRAGAVGHGFYQTRDVVAILGISRRQLQYWAQTDLVVPSATTQGGHRRYSFEDLVSLKAAKRLIDAGVSVQRIRKSIQSLRRTLPTVARPLSELILVATGDLVLVFREDSAFEAVSGQEWVFEVAAFERELKAWAQLPDATQAALEPSRGPVRREPLREAAGASCEAARRKQPWSRTA